MSLRNYVTEGDGCTTVDRPGAQNAFSSLANNIFGQSSKLFQQYQELPGSSSSQYKQQQQQPQGKQQDLIQQQGAPIYNQYPLRNLFQQNQNPQDQQIEQDRVFQNSVELQQQNEQRFLQVFQQMDNFYRATKSDAQIPYQVSNLPFTQEESIKIQTRSQVLARQVQLDRNIQKADSKVHSLLKNLNIQLDAPILPNNHYLEKGRQEQLNEVWQQQHLQSLQQQQQHQQQQLKYMHTQGQSADGWVSEYTQNFPPLQLPSQTQITQPQNWAREFSVDSQILKSPSNLTLSNNIHPWVQQYHQAPSLPNAAQKSRQVNPGSQAWAQQFQDQRSDGLVKDFLQEQGAVERVETNKWAGEFSTDQQTTQEGAHKRNVIEQSKNISAVLSQSSNPKIRNSKFLSFLNKVSAGQIDVTDKGSSDLIQDSINSGQEWATQFASSQQEQAQRGGEGGISQGVQQWQEEFEHQNMESAYNNSIQLGMNSNLQEGWTQDFENENLNSAWGAMDEGQQFSRNLAPNGTGLQEGQGARPQVDVGNLSEGFQKQMNVQDELVKEILKWGGQYHFEQANPFKDQVNIERARQLYQNGVLSEAIMIAEGVVQNEPRNIEAWKLLGVIQAENENDVQAVAALSQALALDGSDLQILLQLGVNHANELQITPTSLCMLAWAKEHPVLSKIYETAQQPNDKSQIPEYVCRLLQQAQLLNSADLDINMALGTQQHMLKKYEEAANTFRQCTLIQDGNFSLWNKLGASLANGREYSKALGAYQRAIEIKPNYVRAWANLGISLASLGQFREACRVYVRALVQNYNQDQLWNYLQSCVQSAGDFNLIQHIETRNMEALRIFYQV